jgi:hypothetical protein
MGYGLAKRCYSSCPRSFDRHRQSHLETTRDPIRDCRKPIVASPLAKGVATDGDLGVDLFAGNLVGCKLCRGACNGLTLLRFDPLVDINKWIQNGLQLVIVTLSERCKFMIVTACALNGQTEQRRADNLQFPLKDGVLIGALFIVIAITVVGSIRTIADIVGGFEKLHQFGRCFRGVRTEAREFILCQLLDDKAIKGFVCVDRANDIVAISIRQRTIGVGTEIAV